MNVDLHIERLVLEGISVPRHEWPALQAAVEGELGRLLAEGALAVPGAAGHVVSLSSVSGGEFQLRREGAPGSLGHDIAGAIYEGIVR